MCSSLCYFQLNAEKSPFQRTYATQVRLFSAVISHFFFCLLLEPEHNALLVVMFDEKSVAMEILF